MAYRIAVDKEEIAAQMAAAERLATEAKTGWGSAHPHLTYEEGVANAMNWLLGITKTPPIGDDQMERVHQSQWK